ncbi:hypothetical protein ACFV84_05555 [Kitasatospora sp. NPDC059811]|uniref:hypothetical protein n=1 Tax=Streptomycetaceae TaxID=2062 RepID=UPI0007AF8AED|nr:hypothetical protein [Streptomyces sp. MJM8645]
MTVLHSRNADAADPADVADAADVKDPQDAKATTAETDLREDLGRYAELGAFTLTADTHAWYAAVDTVATPEDARAASTALAELRGRDLRQTWDAVTVLAAAAKLDEPDTVAKAALLVEMLQRVHRTSATLTTAAYDADLGALAAATADGTWRRENGVKFSWLRARSLRKQATALATDRRIRREDLHEALASAEVERRAWAALAPAGTLPVVPADGALVERTAQAFEAINTGLRGLARMFPDHDLDGLAFAELVDLVERLAADEGTLYRLPTIRGLRTTLEEAGLGDLLTELAAARADRRSAEAAFAARQALAGGQRDGLAGEGSAVEASASVPTPASVEETVTDADADAEADSGDAEAAAVVKTAEAAEEEATEEAPSAVVVSLPAPSPAADDLVAAATAALAEAAETTEAEAVVEVSAVEVEVEAKAEVELAEEAPVLEDAPVVEPETTEEAAEPETVAEVAAVEAPVAEVEPIAEPAAVVVEPVAEVEPAAEPATVEAPVAEADEPVAEVEPIAEPVAVVVESVEATEAIEDVQPVVEVEVVEEAPAAVVVEPVAEVEPAAEPETVAEVDAVEAPVAEADEPVAEVEPIAEPTVVVEPVVEVEAVEEAPAAVVVESVEATEAIEDVQPVVEAEPVVEPAVVVEPVAEVEAVEEAPAVVAEPVAEVVEVEVVESAPVAAGRPEKPDFTPGRPVTAYSADELLAVVRWVDGDGVERTEEELLRAAMKELGFARLGPRIKEALGAAVTAARG